jgi:hypothetical protein
MTAITSFEPGRHLSLVNGKDYLEVKWRLVWLRSEHPNASIETELIAHANGEAIFRALVNIPDGGSATGWGSEDAQGFGDYIEKAETKAIGRALAALGFGTQFCGDFDFGAATGRVVDSPVAMAPTNMSEGAFERGKPATDLEATYRQRNLIQSLSREMKFSANALDELSQELTGQPLEAMSRKNASTLIDALQERRPTRNAIPA